MAHILPTNAEENILTQFARFPYLTSEQVTRLLYSHGSARYVSARLKTLTEEKFLHRLVRETINYPYVYCLGIKGLRYLSSLGFDIPVFHPSEHTRHKPQFLNHTLAVNDFLIAATLLPSTTPEIAVHTIKHDLTLKHALTPVIPDGWIDFRINTHTQVCIWLEMDMGTMDQKPFRKKVSSLLEFSKEEYTYAFGTPSLTVAFATPRNEYRMHSILNWIEQELTTKQAVRDADLFRVLFFPTQYVCPEQVFLSPLCFRPFDSKRVSLLERETQE